MVSTAQDNCPCFASEAIRRCFYNTAGLETLRDHIWLDDVYEQPERYAVILDRGIGVQTNWGTVRQAERLFRVEIFESNPCWTDLVAWVKAMQKAIKACCGTQTLEGVVNCCRIFWAQYGPAAGGRYFAAFNFQLTLAENK